MIIKKDAIYKRKTLNAGTHQFVIITGEDMINDTIHIVEGRDIRPATKGRSCEIGLKTLHYTDGWFLKNYELIYQLSYSKKVGEQNTELFTLLTNYSKGEMVTHVG